MKKVFVCLGLLLFALSAFAQDYERAEVFAGYSYVNFYAPQLKDLAGISPRANLNGFAVSTTTYFNRSLGFEGELAAHFGSGCFGIQGLNCHDVSFMGGPKVAIRGSKGTAFVHALFGGDNGSIGALNVSTSDTKWAMAVGGGVDLNVNPHYSIRVAQVDYFLTHHLEGLNAQNNLRAAAGIVFRFGGSASAARSRASGSTGSTSTRTPLSGPIRIPTLGITVIHENGTHGVRIDEAESGKPAATAGLKRLDVITDVDGKAIDSAEDLQDAVATAKNGHVAVRYMQLGTPAYMTVMVQF